MSPLRHTQNHLCMEISVFQYTRAITTQEDEQMNTSSLIQKVWNFCHTLRDDGVGYGDYLEQLTYLLFLKLAHEYAQEPYKRDTQGVAEVPDFLDKRRGVH